MHLHNTISILYLISGTPNILHSINFTEGLLPLKVQSCAWNPSEGQETTKLIINH